MTDSAQSATGGRSGYQTDKGFVASVVVLDANGDSQTIPESLRWSAYAELTSGTTGGSSVMLRGAPSATQRLILTRLIIHADGFQAATYYQITANGVVQSAAGRFVIPAGTSFPIGLDFGPFALPFNQSLGVLFNDTRTGLVFITAQGYTR